MIKKERKKIVLSGMRLLRLVQTSKSKLKLIEVAYM